MDLSLCSVVVPLHNEEENVRELYTRVGKTLHDIGVEYELILVDDGSEDRSLEIVRELARADRHVRYVSFSRNFGHEAASTAGLERARGDVVVLMDADLQDPPEFIPELLAKWRAGYEVVYARRKKRQGESRFKRGTSWLFYRLLNRLSDVRIPEDVGDFRLMDRRAVEAFKGMPERSRFIRGMIAWVGFRQIAVEYDRPERLKGMTNYSPAKLTYLAVDAMVSFSTALLRFSTIAGLVAGVVSLVMVLVILVQKVFHGIAIPGYALMTAGLFFIGGAILLSLGILGEYVGKIYRQVQARPLFVVREETGDDEVGSV